MQARQGGQPEFRYGWVMIDNSKTEKAAVRLLVLTGDAKGFLLCYFHFLQGWERFLISKEAGVDKVEKNEIMVALADLMHCRNEELFKKKVGRQERKHGCSPSGSERCGGLRQLTPPPSCMPRSRLQRGPRLVPTL